MMAKIVGNPSGRFEDIVAILNQLKANPTWIRIAHRDMDRYIDDFVSTFSKLLERTRRDEDTARSIRELYNLFPIADRLGKEIWDTFEAEGAWDPSTHKLVDRIKATLEADYLTQIFVTKLRLGILYGRS